VSRGVPVNGRVLRQRIMELGLSEREFATTVGIGAGTLRTIVSQDMLVGHLTVATLDRILGESGLSASDLLNRPLPPGDETPSDDTLRLTQVLVSDLRVHPRERLAVAFGWTLDRVDDALNDLHPRLLALGLSVHDNTRGVTVRPRDTSSTDALRRLQQMFDVTEGLDNGEARVLHHAMHNLLGRGNVRKGDRPRLVSLHRQGMIEVNDGEGGGRFRLSDAATFALDVD